MPLMEIEVHGYRSLRSVRIEMGTLNVVTGPNGSGKSNLYRALWLMARVGEGDFAQSICREGGLLSAMWAGPKTNAKKPLRMSLGFRIDDFAFELSCGYPPLDLNSPFGSDPEIKEESVWFGRTRKPSTTLLHREGGMTTIRDVDGNRVEFPLILDPNESVLSQLREPHRYPELFTLREEMRGWRFYHLFRTDEGAPLRTPRASVTTTVLSHDGCDLAAALLTIETIGDRERLHGTIAAALPGRSLRILRNDSEPWSKSPRSMELSVGLDTKGCTRTLEARELSDGTLKFLCLTACLLTPRPPALIALNEPEASLHPDLLRPLAELIVHASTRSQVWVSTHSPILVEAIQALSAVQPIRLQLHNGETIVERDDD